jgi:hypothetical protein
LWLVEQTGDYATIRFHHIRDPTKALEAKLSSIVTTEAEEPSRTSPNPLLALRTQSRCPSGGMSAGERKAAETALQVAMARNGLSLLRGYFGKGFDDPRLNTLFLTMPISWKGTLAQYVGRLHRQHGGKTEVLVVDYVDELVPCWRAWLRSGDWDIGRLVTP